MKAVIQLERTGCGIASVAAITGQSYTTVRRVARAMNISAGDPRLWSDSAHVSRLLRHFGWRTGSRLPFSSWGDLPDLALLSIKWHLERGVPFWHWVVFVRDNGESLVLDSRRGLRSNRRTDFGRMKPNWYIPVTVQ